MGSNLVINGEREERCGEVVGKNRALEQRVYVHHKLSPTLVMTKRCGGLEQHAFSYMSSTVLQTKPQGSD